MQIKPVLFTFLAVGALAACGDTAVEQSLLGAGAGAAGAAVLNTNVAGGALVGAVGNVAYCQQYPSRC
ncbi:hypothetical protein [Lacimonas salitolerans]|uniref:Lipoprotein n=1 Tax=Lacimonas salitolerans TaxID=1323750 RepID=A0ABW4EDI5_9RHOB